MHGPADIPPTHQPSAPKKVALPVFQHITVESEASTTSAQRRWPAWFGPATWIESSQGRVSWLHNRALAH